MEIKQWRVVAPNGQRLSLNMGGYGDSKFIHGSITNNALAAQQFPQYFLPINSEEEVKEVKEIKEVKPTLEEEMLVEEKKVTEKPQMLTEVPKPVDFKPEEKEDAIESDTGTLLVEKKKKKNKSK